MSENQKEPLITAEAVYATATVAQTEYELDGVPTVSTKNNKNLFLRVHTVKPEFSHIPEARDLTWIDDFFENEDDDVVAVFDLDYEAIEEFNTKLGYVILGISSIIYYPIALLAMATLVPCYLRKNVRWATRAKHLAVTRDGIRFVHDKRMHGWGFQCMDYGKKSKTIPFDKITDCDIEEPAGNECCCVPRILFTVHVDTAGSNHPEKRELTVAGIKEPHKFKKLVWAMKRAQQHQPQGLQTLEMIRGDGEVFHNKNNTNEEITNLLREIRDELRQNNEVIKGMKREDPDNNATGGNKTIPVDVANAIEKIVNEE